MASMSSLASVFIGEEAGVVGAVGTEIAEAAGVGVADSTVGFGWSLLAFFLGFSKSVKSSFADSEPERGREGFVPDSASFFMT